MIVYHFLTKTNNAGHSGSSSTSAEDARADLFDETSTDARAPSSSKRMRTMIEPLSLVPETAVVAYNQFDWWFASGRTASNLTDEKPVHLKNAIGESFTRGENDSSWRNSFKAGCEAKVVQVKEGADYQ